MELVDIQYILIIVIDVILNYVIILVALSH